MTFAAVGEQGPWEREMCPGLSMQAQVSFKSEEERDSSVEKLDLFSQL